jgi:hypothetical protein
MTIAIEKGLLVGNMSIAVLEATFDMYATINRL